MLLSARKNYCGSVIVKLIDFLVSLFFHKDNRINSKINEIINLECKVQTRFRGIIILTPNSLTLWRAKTLLTIVPEVNECVLKLQPPECYGTDFQFIYNFIFKRK